MSRPALAVLTPRAPYPLSGGSAIRTNRLIRGLSGEFEVILVTLAHEHEHAPWTRHELEQSLGVEVEVEVVPAPPQADPGLPRLLAPYHRPASRALLTALVNERGVALIQYECPQAAQNGPIAGALGVLDAHNVEYRVPQQLAAVETDPARHAAAERDWRELRDAEQAIWRRMDLCLSVSALDAEAMRSAGARHVRVVPNGTDRLERLPLLRVPEQAPIRALFVGLAEWEPYAQGLEWLLGEVLPAVRATRAIELEVVGRPPRRPTGAAGVCYRGQVDDVTAHYREAEVVVVPVFAGSGTRLKVLEAMRFGRPVVSTSIGAEGLPVRAGEHYLEADTPERFAAAILELAERSRRGDAALEAMVARARAAVEPFTWRRIAAELAAFYSAELARRAERRPVASWT